MKAIIFPHGFGYAVTSEENYNAQYRDANKICDIMPPFKPEEIAKCLVDNGSYDEVEIVKE